MINLTQGFKIGSVESIDSRFILSRNDMYYADDNVMPDYYFAICKEDKLLYVYVKALEKTMPNGRFVLANDLLDIKIDGVSIVQDPPGGLDYLHKRVADIHIPINVSELTNDANYAKISEVDAKDQAVKDWSDAKFALINKAANKIKLELEEETYKLQAVLYDLNEVEISRSNIIDLPIESFIVKVEYDATRKELVITLKNGQVLRIPLSGIIEGLATETYVQQKIAAEDVAIKEWSNENFYNKANTYTKTEVYSKSEADLKVAQAVAAEATVRNNADQDLQNQILQRPTESDVINMLLAKQDKFNAGNGLHWNQLTSEGLTIDADSYVTGRGINVTDVTPAGATYKTYQLNADATAPTWEAVGNKPFDVLGNHLVVEDSEGVKRLNVDIPNDVATKSYVDAAVSPKANQSDLASHVNNSSIHLSSQDKERWNAKQDAITADNKLSTNLITGLAAVATSGDYNDLQNIPEEAEVNNGKLTIKQNNVNKGEFTANQKTDTSINIEVPLKVGDLQNDKNYITIEPVNTLLDKTVLNGLTVETSGDTVTLKHSNINLKTGAIGAESDNLPLADSSTAGLMSPADVKAIADLKTDVASLKGQTARLIYQRKDILDEMVMSVTYVDSTTKESYTVGYTISGTNENMKAVVGEGSKQPAGTEFTGSLAEGITIYELGAAIDPIKYFINLSETPVVHEDLTLNQYETARDATKQSIGSFALDQGFVADFVGLAIIIEGTYHVWRYYPNKDGGVVIGWRDDGADTVTQFTNETAGIIKGSTEAGKVYAENDGTGSVNGWSSLITRVDTVEGVAAGNTTAIGNEVTARTNADSALDGRITTNTTNISNLSDQLTAHTGNSNNPHAVSKAQVGLGNVDNKSSETIRSEITEDNITSKVNYGAKNGSGLVKYDKEENTYNFAITQTSNIVVETTDWEGIEDSEGTVICYLASKAVTGVTVASKPVLDVVINPGDYSAIDEINEAWSKVYCGLTTDGYINLYAKEAPTRQLTIQAIGY